MADQRMAGSVIAKLGAYDVVDYNGDLVLSGALVNEFARVSAWNHSSVEAKGGAPPVGMARLREEAGQLVAEVRFDYTWEGRKAWERVYQEGPAWSVWFRSVELRRPTAGEQGRGARRVVAKWRILEVSPVGQGAGVSTGTRSVCCGSCSAHLPPKAEGCWNCGSGRPWERGD